MRYFPGPITMDLDVNLEQVKLNINGYFILESLNNPTLLFFLYLLVIN